MAIYKLVLELWTFDRLLDQNQEDRSICEMLRVMVLDLKDVSSAFDPNGAMKFEIMSENVEV